MQMKTVIFDMDGVIFDTESLYLSCWRRLAGQYGFTDVEAVYHQTIGTNPQTARMIFMKTYGENAPYDEFNGQAGKMFHKYIADNGMPMKPGVREVLDFLTADGYRIGLASSTPIRLVREQLAGRDLLSCFQVVIGGDMVTQSKPAPDIFLKACADIGALPAEAFAVEDSFHGIRAAVAAGMKGLMVPDVVPPDEEMKALAYRIFPSLYEVRDFFAALSLTGTS